MTLSATSAPTSNLGFLTIQCEPTGTLGGYLVTNTWGRPLEFRLTSAVQPNRVQHILYGASLENYLCGDLIGKTLVEKSGTPVQWLVTDHRAALVLRERLKIPVSLWHPGELNEENLLVVSQHLYCDDHFPGDVPTVQRLLEKLNNFDLGEPFQRIRDAMHEARKMGVSKAA